MKVSFWLRSKFEVFEKKYRFACVKNEENAVCSKIVCLSCSTYQSWKYFGNRSAQLSSSTCLRCTRAWVNKFVWFDSGASIENAVSRGLSSAYLMFLANRSKSSLTGVVPVLLMSCRLNLLHCLDWWLHEEFWCVSPGCMSKDCLEVRWFLFESGEVLKVFVCSASSVLVWG